MLAEIAISRQSRSLITRGWESRGSDDSWRFFLSSNSKVNRYSLDEDAECMVKLWDRAGSCVKSSACHQLPQGFRHSKMQLGALKTES